MIEKRTMWLVENSLEIRQVVALYDIEKKEVVCEHYAPEEDEEEDGDWYQVIEGEQFFNTEQEAREHRKIRIEEAREKMKTCLALIHELDKLETADDFMFKKSDYLGNHAEDQSEEEYWRKRREKYEKTSSLFATIARSRHFNVAGQTINIDEVVRVKWHDKESATLVMRDGTNITTYTAAEFDVVEGMFGSNRSNRYKTRPINVG